MQEFYNVRDIFERRLRLVFWVANDGHQAFCRCCRIQALLFHHHGRRGGWGAFEVRGPNIWGEKWRKSWILMERSSDLTRFYFISIQIMEIYGTFRNLWNLWIIYIYDV